MALKCNIELESGLAITDAYLRIISFSGTENYLEFTLNIYVNKQTFDDGRSAISTKSYNMIFDKDRNLFRQAYEHLLTLPEYENAVEA